MATKKVTKNKIEISPSNLGLIAYIIGIVAIVESFISPLAGIVLGVIGLSFSSKEKSKLAKKAKILNIASILIGAIIFILIMFLSVNQLGGILPQ